jgi:hypothetical protein
LSGNNIALGSAEWVKNQSNIIWVSSEDKVQSAVVNTPGAIGIAGMLATLEEATMKVRVQRPTGEVVSPNLIAAYRCFPDTYNSTSMGFRLSTSTQRGCWPFTTYVNSMVRQENTGDECVNAYRALTFLQFIHARMLNTCILHFFHYSFSFISSSLLWLQQ